MRIIIIGLISVGCTFIGAAHYLLSLLIFDMKKHYFLLMALLSLSMGLIAQTPNAKDQNQPAAGQADAATGKWAIGISAAPTINTHVSSLAYMKNYTYVPQLSMSYGVDVRYQPYKWLGVRTGIYRIPKNYVLNQSDTIKMGDNPLEFARGELSRNMYVNVPFMADLSVGKKVRYHLFLGGYVGYWYGGSIMGSAMPLMLTSESSIYEGDYVFDSRRDNRFEAGINYGLGLSIPCFSHFGIDVNMLWYYGLTDMQKNTTRQHIPHYNTTFLLQAGITYRWE